MSQDSPVMTIMVDEQDQGFAKQIATALGYHDAHVVIGSPSDAIIAIQQREESPRYLVIDIGSRESDVLSELDSLAEYCTTDTRAIVIGSINDVNFYRELRQRGILEYFTRPAKVSEIRAALVTGDSDTSTGSSTVISFMSAASGDGSSTVALNTAYCIANNFNKSVVIIDMDYQFGMLARNLDLSTPFGIKELFEHPDRSIDATLVDRMLVPYGDNLKVIAAPNDLRLWPEIQPDLIRNLITTLKESFEYIIIDLPHIWSTWSATALNSSTQNVMVAQLWLRSVTHTARLLNIWRTIGIDKDSVLAVINRSGAKFKEAVTARDYETVCDKSIDFYLTNDIKTIVAAENQGITVPEVGNSLLGKQFFELAKEIITRHEDISDDTAGKDTAPSGLARLAPGLGKK